MGRFITIMMDKTRKILLTECLSSLALVLIIALVFETGIVGEGLLTTEDGTSQFVIQSLMTFLLFLTIPGALYLFRVQRVKRSLVEEKASGLLRWGSVRLLLLCVPMVLDMAFYYLLGAVVGFFYMTVIYVLSLFFVFPTKRRCAHDCLPVAEVEMEKKDTLGIQ